MNDFLLELGQNPTGRKLIKGLGLPIPVPEVLRRAEGPYGERPLEDRVFVVGGAATSSLVGALATTLARAGANPRVASPALLEPFKAPGEAYGRPAKTFEAPAEGAAPAKVDGLVFDASSLESPADLGGLFEFFHPLVGSVTRSGRVVVLGRPPEGQKKLAAAAAQSALEGFVRSLAKEVGKRGATANLVYVADGAEGRLEPVLRFLLSDRSAFVSGQPIRVRALAKGTLKDPGVRPLEGKVALVTGAARGIGEATARRLAEEGAEVVALDRPDDDQPLSQVVRSIGGRALLLDITAPDAPAKIAEALPKGVDVVVHNAGITRDKTLAKMRRELWDQAVEVNLGAVVRINEKLVDAGKLNEGARVICLSSVAGIAGNVGQTNYAASKSGLIAYVRAFADRAADRGITVNAIAPGFIETRLTAAIPVAIREVGRRMSNLGQGGLPADVAEAITFLATPGSLGVSGELLRVCGGALIGA